MPNSMQPKYETIEEQDVSQDDIYAHRAKMFAQSIKNTTNKIKPLNDQADDADVSFLLPADELIDLSQLCADEDC